MARAKYKKTVRKTRVKKGSKGTCPTCGKPR